MRRAMSMGALTSPRWLLELRPSHSAPGLSKIGAECLRRQPGGATAGSRVTIGHKALLVRSGSQPAPDAWSVTRAMLALR